MGAGAYCRTAVSSGAPSYSTRITNLLIATLKLRLRTPRRPAPSQKRLDVGRLRDPEIAQGFASRLEEALSELDASADTQTLWEGFKRCTLDAADASIPEKPRRSKESISEATAELIESSRRARLDGNTELYRSLKRDA